MKTKTIYTMRMAQHLINRGFVPLAQVPNAKDITKTVWLFAESEDFNQACTEYVAASKQRKETGRTKIPAPIDPQCELFNMRETFYLLDRGFVPENVYCASVGGLDWVCFRKSPELIEALDSYRQKAGGPVSVFCDAELLQNIAPHDYSNELIVYSTWGPDERKACLMADPSTRKQMIDDVCNKGRRVENA